MKILDRLIIKSFISPFIVTFTIAMFVLVMQVLWLYIDDIAGKGLGLFLILELMGYKSLSLVPMALPLAILISSVMVLGNMGERYELSSFKSAGVSLWRIMIPIMYFGIATTFFSFFCSNNLIPVANLKFGSRMYDIQKQKPTLRLEAGIFNDDFDGYAIHIGRKEGDGKHIEDVLIYDHSEANKGRLSQIVAKEGEMYATEDGRYFMMQLRDGHQYMEGEQKHSGQDRTYPFVRTNFDSWFKVFDLSEFNLNRTNEELFRSNRRMMTSGQLQNAIDSLGTKIDRRQKGISNQVSSYFHFMEIDSTYIKEKKAEDLDGAPRSLEQQRKDSKQNGNEKPEGANGNTAAREPQKVLTKSGKAAAARPEKKQARRYEGTPMEQQRDKPIEEYSSILELFPKQEHNRLVNKAKSYTRSIQAHSESADRSLYRLRESEVKHIYELHTKYSMALVCFIFLFIGAPMGAIVRKGGFGYPILISIVFFMIFIVLTIFCRKIAETFVLPAAAAAWIPCAVLFPIGLFLTRKAMNDRKLGDPEQLVSKIRKLVKAFRP